MLKQNDFLKVILDLIKIDLKKLYYCSKYEVFLQFDHNYHTYEIHEFDSNNKIYFIAYAYYYIFYICEDDQISMNKYDQIELSIDLYEKGCLSPTQEIDLFKNFERENIFKGLSELQINIIKYKQVGYKNYGIANCLNLSEDYIEYQLDIAIKIIKSYLTKIKIS